MYQSYVAKVLKLYRIDVQKILPSQKGYRNEVYPFVLPGGENAQITFFKSEPKILERIARADAVSEFAAQNKLPTRVRLNPQTVKLANDSRTIYTGLYNYLPGTTIAWEAYTKTHIKLLGKTLSDLHAVLARQKFVDSPLVIDEYLVLLKRMNTYFKQSDVKQAIETKLHIVVEDRLNRFKKLLENCRNLSGNQQLHMDFVRGNILFDKAKPSDNCQLDGLAITGILDFEKTAVGHPLFDVARTLAFLMVDCKYKTEAQIKRYFIYSGYQKRGQARLFTTHELLDQLVEFFLLYDFYKFLRHNPYESLQQNEHFMRTKDILATRDMIHYN